MSLWGVSGGRKKQSAASGLDHVPEADEEAAASSQSRTGDDGQGVDIGKKRPKLTYHEALFFTSDTGAALTKSDDAKKLKVEVNAADVAVVQSGLEALMWQLFDAEMADSGAHLWLQISVEVSCRFDFVCSWIQSKYS